MSSDPRYPVGTFQPPEPIGARDRAQYIEIVEACPSHLRNAVEGLSPEQLDTPYREGGWTVRQVVHHVPDSHMNAYVRFKLALTEDQPIIKPYDEAAWAMLSDASGTPVEVSLDLLDSLHKRWVLLLRGITDAGWHRPFVHPEMGARVPLDRYLALYAWHSRHHVAHITALRKRRGW